MAFHLTQSELNALAKVDKAPYDLAPIPSLSLLLLLPHSIPPSLSSSHTGLFPFSFKSLALSCLRAFALSSPSAWSTLSPDCHRACSLTSTELFSLTTKSKTTHSFPIPFPCFPSFLVYIIYLFMICLPLLECRTSLTATSSASSTETNSFQTPLYNDCFIITPA